jgi:hypothetical protein
MMIPLSTKNLTKILVGLTLLVLPVNCGNGVVGSGDQSQTATQNASNTNRLDAPRKAGPPGKNTGRVIHALVALCDNVNQGIVPVPPRLGNGEDLKNNLYWGAAYGVKTFFSRSADWTLAAQMQNPQADILERCVFKHKTKDVYLVADAYRGAAIQQSIMDFLEYASGGKGEILRADKLALQCGGGADLIAYVGHNGLMDFALSSYPKPQDDRRRDAIMLCCASKNYFSAPLKTAGATPLLWTTNLMAPEAYILKAAIDGWILHESAEQVRMRAAQAYNTYQKCGLKAARNLFSSSW